MPSGQELGAMAKVKTCKFCLEPIVWNDELQRFMDAEPNYMAIETDGPHIGYSANGQTFQGTWLPGMPKPGTPWKVLYRTHVCRREAPTPEAEQERADLK